MKNYHFKIQTDTPEVLLKKTFVLKLANNIHPYDMFDNAISYLNNNPERYFKISGDCTYFDFSIIRGKKKASCWLEHEYCPHCGGEVNIGGEYEE